VRLVLDTNIIVGAMRSPRSASAELLREIVRGNAILLLSLPLALEYEAVCSRTQHWTAAGLTLGDAKTFVDGIIAMATAVEVHFLVRPLSPDPDDDHVLEAATNGRASAIVTFNEKDLRIGTLALGIELMRPNEVLRRIRR
jgi:predicted nucleic acid-binding protein